MTTDVGAGGARPAGASASAAAVSQSERIVIKEQAHAELVRHWQQHSIVVDGDRRAAARAVLVSFLSRYSTPIPREEQPVLLEEILDEAFGLGCLERFIADPAVTEIMVNGPHRVFIEVGGRLRQTDARFTSTTQLMTAIDRIVAPLGRRIDESSPLVDARLPDGSRVNAVIPPVSLIGPVLTIRKFSRNPLMPDDLIARGAFTAPMAVFLRACVRLRRNIVIAGGTGSGKTTLLNAISSYIPSDERIVTIEDAAELQLLQDHVVRLESRPPSMEGKGEIPIRRLVVNALRMRPDRIIVGECRAGETLDMLQAMNTGHDGSLTTLHANTPRDAISRLVTMALMAGADLPERAIRDQIAAAVHIIVQIHRMQDGSRKVTEISELVSAPGEAIALRPIFTYRQQGMVEGVVQGTFIATGTVPGFLADAGARGVAIDPSLFQGSGT